MEHIDRPTKFAHIVYRTYQYDKMIAWYQTVFGAKIQFGNPALTFLTYDDEHHRVALLNLDLLLPQARELAGRAKTGVDHVAYCYKSLPILLSNYERLRDLGIKPYWCIHHGITISMYYADPDGNQMEFQVDCFESNEDANDFMSGPGYGVNPIGVEYDPEEYLARLRAGEPEKALLTRNVHLPVSDIRGSFAA
ncbi:VOC family protein [Ottowia caeni]|uniref:VOC family protein n=1 Tax=Ottowia caeni TaxID=2870339 RepID=UPI001E3BFE0A|nr:VOC family protein [Ottowia caeni]